MGRTHARDAFRAGDEADHAEIGRARRAEDGDGFDRAASGGEHWINEDDGAGFEVFGEFLEVDAGLEGVFVAGEAEVTDAGFGHHLHDAFGHAQARAEHGDDGDLCRESAAAGDFHRGLDVDLVGGEGAGDFKDHEAGDLVEQRTERAVAGGCVAQVGELVLDEGMIEDDHARVVVESLRHGEGYGGLGGEV